MMVTTKPQDKFAFLFSGITDDRSINDLEKMYETLTEFYNYKPENIWVVQGTNPFIGDFTNLPVTNKIEISTVAELETAFNTFAEYVHANDVNLAGTDKNTAVIYFTGNGTNSGGSKIIINDASDIVDDDIVDTNWLTSQIDSHDDDFNYYLETTHVAIIMQQSYSGGFQTAIDNVNIVSEKTFIAACGENEISDGGASGGDFTEAFTSALKQNEKLPIGSVNANKYADQLVTGTEEFLISLEEALLFAKEKNDVENYSYHTWGEIHKYLGKPLLYIRDGSPQWWESLDINLEHPNHLTADIGDLYIPDALDAVAPFNNTICIDTRNIGTHPVRSYSLGIELYKTGAGATNEKTAATNIEPAEIILKPTNISDIETVNDVKDTYRWNTPFYTGLRHECVKSEAKLKSADVDFSWNIRTNDFEAQRNTDEMTLVPSPAPTPAPAPEQGDEGHNHNSGNDFRGKNESVYAIQNPFKEDKIFIIAFPREWIRLKNLIKINLFWFKDGNNPIPLKIQNDGFSYVELEVKANENKEILFRLEMSHKYRLRKPVKLPFEILVKGEFNKPELNKPLTNAFNPKKYAPIAGITVILKKGYSTIKGVVLDTNNKPVAGANVYLRTFNERNVATVTTNKRGKYILRDINPNNYFLKAESDNFSSDEKVTFLTKGMVRHENITLSKNEPIKYKKIKVILDKVLILDDHDQGKNMGEIIFTSLVVPDNNYKERQLKVFPKDGNFYKVSDKHGEIELGTTIFEGKVKNNHLKISIGARDYDYHINPDDPFVHYFKVFSGNPENWIGEYKPNDEKIDKERMKDWAIWYRIIEE